MILEGLLEKCQPHSMELRAHLHKWKVKKYVLALQVRAVQLSKLYVCISSLKISLFLIQQQKKETGRMGAFECIKNIF